MPKITFLKTGETFEVPAGTSFLEFCQDQGAPHDFGCTVGSCGTCVLFLEEGADHVNPKTVEEQDTVDMVTKNKAGRLGCQLTVHGDITVRVEPPPKHNQPL
jgi:ferredoxin